MSDFVRFVEGRGKFMWLTSSGNACRKPMGGCDARNEVVATLEEWVARGLPRTGWSVCQGRCYCLLVPLLDIGLDTPAELGGETVSTGLGSNDRRGSDEPFSDVDRLDPEDFVADLRNLLSGLVGRALRKLEELIEDFVAGRVRYERARKDADIILGLGR